MQRTSSPVRKRAKRAPDQPPLFLLPTEEPLANDTVTAVSERPVLAAVSERPVLAAVSAPTKRRRKNVIAFGWYGGKYSHLGWLLPLLPETHHYCEPYGGSAAVLLNRSPASVETYNDLDGDVVHFFRVLREQKEQLIETIGLTPFSREEFFDALEINATDLTPLERARRF